MKKSILWFLLIASLCFPFLLAPASASAADTSTTRTYNAPVKKIGSFQIKLQVDPSVYGEIGQYSADFDADGQKENLSIVFFANNGKKTISARMSELGSSNYVESALLSWNEGDCYTTKQVDISCLIINGKKVIAAELMESGTMATGYSTTFKAIQYTGRSYREIFNYNYTGSNAPSSVQSQEINKFRNAGFNISSLKVFNGGRGDFVSDQLRGEDICKLSVSFNGTNLYAFANGSINTIEPFRYIIESPRFTSSDVIQVTLDGKSLNFDQPPIIDNNRVMVPIRTIFEALGYTVNWQNSTQTAIANKAGHSIIVQVNNPKITYNGGSYYCDVSPKNLSGRILVPVRAVSESAGCEVIWQSSTQTVMIQS